MNSRWQRKSTISIKNENKKDNRRRDSNKRSSLNKIKKIKKSKSLLWNRNNNKILKKNKKLKRIGSTLMKMKMIMIYDSSYYTTIIKYISNK